MEYIFTLKDQLPDDHRDADARVERLGEAGCDDALVGDDEGPSESKVRREARKARQCAGAVDDAGAELKVDERRRGQVI